MGVQVAFLDVQAVLYVNGVFPKHLSKQGLFLQQFHKRKQVGLANIPVAVHVHQVESEGLKGV